MQELQPAQVAARRPPQKTTVAANCGLQEDQQVNVEDNLLKPRRNDDDDNNDGSIETLTSEIVKKKEIAKKRRSQKGEEEGDISQCDFKTRMKLLQSKLHPNSSNLQAATDHSIRDHNHLRGGGSICSSRNENSNPILHQSQLCNFSDDDDGESLSSRSSSSSSSSCRSASASSSSSSSSSCSPPPTPPPRHSSLLNSNGSISMNRANKTVTNPEASPSLEAAIRQDILPPPPPSLDRRMQIQLADSSLHISDNDALPTTTATKMMTTMQLDTHAIQRNRLQQQQQQQQRQKPTLCHGTPLPPIPVPVATSEHIGQVTALNNGGNGQLQILKAAHHANQSSLTLQPSIAIRQNLPQANNNNLQKQSSSTSPPLIQGTSISHNQLLLETSGNNFFVGHQQQQKNLSSSSLVVTCGGGANKVNYLPQPPISGVSGGANAFKTCYNNNNRSIEEASPSLMDGLKSPFVNSAAPSSKQPPHLSMVAPFLSMVDLHRPIQQQQQHSNSRLSDSAAFDNFLHSKQPITKAVRNMVNKQQQQQQQQQTVSYVINTPSSRHPIRGCPLPPIPPNKPPNLISKHRNLSPSQMVNPPSFRITKSNHNQQQLPPQLPSKSAHLMAVVGAPQAQARRSHQLGSHQSISMSSISSQASSVSSAATTCSSTSASAAAVQLLARNLTPFASNNNPFIRDSHLSGLPSGSNSISTAATTTTINNKTPSPTPKTSLKTNDESINRTSSKLKHIKDSKSSRRRRECFDDDDQDEELLSSAAAAAPEVVPIDEDCCECNCSSSFESHPADTIVNEQGDHCVVFSPPGSNNSACQQLELNGDLFALDEECGSLMMSRGGCSSDQPSPPSCCQQPSSLVVGVPIPTETEMRGWPVGEFDDDDDYLEEDEEADDFVLLNRDSIKPGMGRLSSTMWPIVGLHENPMNWLSPAGSVSGLNGPSFVVGPPSSCGEGEDEGEGEEGGESSLVVENLLERSRLLSLQESQLKNRAAIRMISSDSVQLLVSEFKDVKKEIISPKEEEEEQTKNESSSSSSDNTSSGQVSTCAKIENTTQANCSKETTTTTTSEESSGGGTLVIVAAQRGEELTSRGSLPGNLSASCASGGQTKEGHDFESNREPSSSPIPSPNSGSSSSSISSSSKSNSSSKTTSCTAEEFNKLQQQQQQARQRRHVEQLMRLKQLAGKVSPAGRPREELPTLDELQRQIQLACESASAAGASSLFVDSKRQRDSNHQNNSNDDDDEQAEWPATTQQRQQQQQQQQHNSNNQQNHSGNEAASEQPKPTVKQQQQPVQQRQVKLPARMESTAPAALSMQSDSSAAAAASAIEMEEQQMDEHKSPPWPPVLVSPSSKSSSNAGAGQDEKNYTAPMAKLNTPPINHDDDYDQKKSVAASSNGDNLLTTADQVKQQQQQHSRSVCEWQYQRRTSGPNNIQDELSISTANMDSPPQIDRLSQARRPLLDVSLMSSSSGQSTPVSLSECSGTLAESDMIPRLIERLDRKLVVMKEEQLTLMREIELNESTGQRLFESMKRRLTSCELDKISLNANEIEKVTKLILSLKLRLKRVETELKERSKKQQYRDQDKQQQQQQRSPASSGCNLTPPLDEQAKSLQHNLQKSSQINSSSSLEIVVGPASSSLSSRATTLVEASRQSMNNSNNPPVRGVSDPTSTIGLPKRNHQHHASLQMDSSKQQNIPSTADRVAASCRPINEVKLIGRINTNDDEDYSLSNCLSSSSSSASSSASAHTSGCNSRVGSPRVDANHATTVVSSRQQQQPAPIIDHHHRHDRHHHHHRDSHESKSAKSSSDSIFNSADSAIGSTITGHGGSTNNIEDAQQQQPIGSSIQASESSLASNDHSVISSHDESLSSASILNSTLGQQQQQQKHLRAPESLLSSSTSMLVSPKQQQQQQPNTGASILSPTGSCQHQRSSNAILDRETIQQMLNDVDILMAKRTKLVSQLEEAHQLEECIVRRNNVIVQRILRKYFDESSPEGLIAEFRQFTKLKSLLLKDSHDIADRIDNAELQLNELKQTNQCSSGNNNNSIA